MGAFFFVKTIAERKISSIINAVEYELFIL